MDDTSRHYLKYVVFPAGHEASKNALVRALGDEATLEQMLSMSDDKLLELPGIGLRKLVAVHKLREAENITILEAVDAVNETVEYAEESLEFLVIETDLKYKALFDLLIRNLGPETKLSEVVALGEDALLELPSFGKGKLLLLLEYLRLVGYEANLQPVSINKTLDIKLNQDEMNAPVSTVALPASMRLRVERVVNKFDDIETVEDLLKFDFARLRLLSGFGKKKLSDLKQVIQGIADGTYLIDHHTEASNDNDNSLSAYSLTFVEELLVQRLESFIETLSERDQYIFVHRLGFQSDKRTLEDIAQSLPGGTITRERVRQLESKLIRQWQTQCGLLSSRLWFTLQENLVLGDADLLPKLCSKFADESDFYKFLALTCGRSDKELLSVVNPKIPYSSLDSFWLENSSPAPLVNLINYLKDELAYDDAVARNIIYRAREEGRLDVWEKNVAPLKLSKTNAVVNTLLDFKSGAKWEVIHRRANEKNISNNKLDEERLDTAIMASVDSGHVYQSARGKYCHIAFLHLDENLIDSVLTDIRDELLKQQNSGRSALHLMTDYFRHRSLPLDYFVVRHIVRSKGEQVGVFFNGKSGADTISLDSNFSAISQLKAIEDFLLSSRKPISKYDVAKMIRSGSVGHANFYLEQLGNQGKVVYLGDECYGAPEFVYENVDVENILRAANGFLTHERRILDVAILTKRLNRKLGLEHDKHFYFGLLKTNAEKYGYKWFFGSHCIATHKLEFWSISTSIRHFIEQGVLDADELLNEVDKYFLFEPSTAKLAISNLLGAKRREMKEREQLSEDELNRFDNFTEKCESVYPEYGSHLPLTKSQQRQLKRLADNEFGHLDEMSRCLWILRLAIIRYLDVKAHAPLGAQFILLGDGSARVPLLENALQLADALSLQRRPLEQFILDGDDEGSYRYLLLGYLNFIRDSFGELFNDQAIQSLVNDFGSLTKTDSILRKFYNIISEDQASNLRLLNDIYSWAINRTQRDGLNFRFNQTFLDNWLSDDKDELSRGRHESPESLKVLVWPSAGGYVLSRYFQVLADLYRTAGFRRRDVCAKVVNNNLFAKVDSELDLYFTRATITLAAVSYDKRNLGVPLFSNKDAITTNDANVLSGAQEFDRVVLSVDTSELVRCLEPISNGCSKTAKFLIQTTKQVLIDPTLEYWRRSVVHDLSLKSLSVAEDELGIALHRSSSSESSNIEVNEYSDSKIIRNQLYDAQLFLYLPRCEFCIHSPSEVAKYFSFEPKRLGDHYDFKVEESLTAKPPTARYWFELYEEAPDDSFDGWYLSGNDFLSTYAEPLHIVNVLRETTRGTIKKLRSKSFMVNVDQGLKTSWVSENVYYSTSSGRVLESKDSNFGMADSWLLLDIFHKFVALGQLSSSDSVNPFWLLKLPVPMFDRPDLLQSYKEEIKSYKYRTESSPAFKRPFYLCKAGQPLQESFEVTYGNDCARMEQVNHDIEELRQSMLSRLEGTCFDTLLGNVIVQSEILSSANENSREKVFFSYAQLLISFAFGCIFGRYNSLPGVYEVGPRNVNILLLTDRPFFEEDATITLHAWLRSVVGDEYIKESWHSLNMYLSADNFSSSAVRSYINDKFFDDHCNTFLGKPIYWRITSGPQRAFECFVYVHRFDETTLPKIRIDYLQPLITKYEKLLEHMPVAQESASSIVDKIALKEEEKLLRLKVIEAQKFDDKLRYAADARFGYQPDYGISRELRRLRELGIDVQ